MKEKKEETKNENQPWKKQQMPIPLLMEKKCQNSNLEPYNRI